APGATGTCACDNPTGAPYTCANVPNGPSSPGGHQCGPFGDGCGGTLSCPCGGGEVCNLSISPHACCAPTACPTPVIGAACGSISDGCGGTHACGCPPVTCAIPRAARAARRRLVPSPAPAPRAVR